MTLDALIFDFDGTILDTESADFAVLSEQYAAHGATLLPERWVLGLGTMGGWDPYGDLETHVGQPFDRAASELAHRARYRELCDALDVRPGVLALIAAAQRRDIALAIASSSSAEWVGGWVERHGLASAFTVIRTREAVRQVKPAPDLFLSAAAGLGLAPARCAVIEDSLNGMRAAYAAGMRCVAVPLPLIAMLELPPHTIRLETLDAMLPDELLDALAAA